MKIQAVSTNVFWSNQSENKPSRELIDSLKFIELPKSLSYIDQFNGRVTFERELEYNYIKFDNMYWYKTREVKGNSVNKEYEFTVDFYTTYFLLKDTDKVATSRNHIMSDSSFQYQDSLLDSVPIKKQREILKTPYEYKPSTVHAARIEYTLAPKGEFHKRAISTFETNNRVVNSNIYFAFNKGAGVDYDNKITFVPILNTNSYPSFGSLYDEYKYNGSVITHTFEYDTEKSISLLENEIKKRGRPNRAFWKGTGNPSIDNLTVNDINILMNLFSKPVTKKLVYTYSWLVISFFETKVIFSNDITMSKSLKFVGGYPKISLILEWDTSTTQESRTSIGLKNEISFVYDLIKDTDLAGEFKGVYILPNFLNFENVEVVRSGKFKDFLVISMDTDAIDISLPDINKFKVENDILKYNLDNNVLSRSVLEYFKVMYYNNELLINYYGEEDVLRVSGKFLFNGVGTIIQDTPILDVKDSVIVYPNNLPINTDSYFEYVNGISASVNNGIRAQGINSFSGMAAGLVNSGIQAAGGNFVGATTGALSSIGNGFNAMQQQRKGLKAQFDDMKKTKNTVQQSSNIEDSSYLALGNKELWQESYQLISPDSDSLKLLNNVIYFYGNINAGVFTFKDLTNRSIFNYIEFNKQWLIDYINTIPLIDTLTKNMIYNTVENGVRIWNETPDVNNYKDNGLKVKKNEE